MPADKRDRVFGIAGQLQHLLFGHDRPPETVGDFGSRHIVRGEKNEVRRLVSICIGVVLVRSRTHHKRTAFYAIQ